MSMFYSKLRWKIRDLEKELEDAVKGKEHWRNEYNDVIYKTAYAESKINGLKENVMALEKEKYQLLSENETIAHDLDMAGQQFEAANEEIGRLQKENDHLREQLRKKGGCPCDKRRKH